MLLAVPTVSFAHTHVQTTVPENGATVTAPLKEIKLTFETPIEKISTMTVAKDGQNISLASQKVEGHDLIASVDQPLENGSYAVNWEIVGEDGHVIKDSIAFKVDVKDEAKEENTQAAGKDSEKAGRHAIRTAPKSAAANDEKRRTMILHRFCYRDYCYCSGGWSITLNLQKEKGLKR